MLGFKCVMIFLGTLIILLSVSSRATASSSSLSCIHTIRADSTTKSLVTLSCTADPTISKTNYLSTSRSAQWTSPLPSPTSSTLNTSQNFYNQHNNSLYSGDITVYEPNNYPGACGILLRNQDLVVALAKDAWGESTYDLMTGAATNRWCNQTIQVFYHEFNITATIMDMCPGCSGHDIDLSPAAWKRLTGSDEKTRYQAKWAIIER
jgi:hypothetical protein